VQYVSNVKLHGMVTTKMHCGDDSKDKEYNNALKFVKSYEINSEGLHIFYGDNSKLNFTGE
jgi:hypothetical protein